jgi:transposase-like protein
MPARIPESVKLEARARWIRGGLSDEALARELGIRPGTLRAWKDKENWPALRDQLHGIVADEVQVRVMKERAALNQKHDQLGDALEAMIVRKMRDRGSDGSSSLEASDIRALAGALAATQRVRRIATGIDRLPERAESFGPTTIVFHPAMPPEGLTRGAPTAGAS